MSVSTLRTQPAAVFNQAPAALVVEHVTKRFGAGANQITAVEDMSFHVAPGELVSIIGPSGCGKSTLFNIVGGLIEEYEGRILVKSEPGKFCEFTLEFPVKG